MKLHELRAAKGATHKPKPRLGRGEASGKGGTSTKGNKGGQSRAGYASKMAHEGGQMPIQRRIPKRGFGLWVAPLAALRSCNFILFLIFTQRGISPRLLILLC